MEDEIHGGFHRLTTSLGRASCKRDDREEKEGGGVVGSSSSSVLFIPGGKKGAVWIRGIHFIIPVMVKRAFDSFVQRFFPPPFRNWTRGGLN